MLRDHLETYTSEEIDAFPSQPGTRPSYKEHNPRSYRGFFVPIGECVLSEHSSVS